MENTNTIEFFPKNAMYKVKFGIEIKVFEDAEFNEKLFMDLSIVV